MGIQRVDLHLLFVAVVAASNAIAADAAGTYLPDPEDSALFTEALKQRGISFRVDEAGHVWYSAKDASVAQELSASIRRRCLPGYAFRDGSRTPAFLERLRQEGIPYRVCRQLGREYVSWDPKFDDRARHLIFVVNEGKRP